MSQIRETCGCGAVWVGPDYCHTDRDKFREAHNACRRSTESKTERIFDCMGCGKVIQGEHVVKGMFTYHRECVAGLAPTPDTASEEQGEA